MVSRYKYVNKVVNKPGWVAFLPVYIFSQMLIHAKLQRSEGRKEKYKEYTGR